VDNGPKEFSRNFQDLIFRDGHVYINLFSV
jgi:hypothetical protein